MSAIFRAMDIAQSGLHVYRAWMDAVSHNISNASTVRPTSGPAFRSQLVVAQALSTGGVRVAGTEWGSADGRVVSDPTHPFADEDGLVRQPDVDLGEQMVSLLMAQRGYQANLAVVERARDAYLQALQIGS
jgi:flagellar basal-body rod protein FlgC